MEGLEFSQTALKDLEYWKKTGNNDILKRVRKLLESVQESPFTGIGKPEALKYGLSGLWSRRIDGEHRLVYEVTDEKVIVHSLKGHYKS